MIATWLTRIAKWRKTWFFFFLSISIYCVPGFCRDQIDIEDARIEKSVAQLARRKYGLFMDGSGWSFDTQVEKIRGKSFSFYAKKILEVNEARAICLKLTLDTLRLINTDKKFRKQLYEYPFGARNIRISIFSKNVDASYYQLPKVLWVSFNHSYLSFGYNKGEPKYKNNLFPDQIEWITNQKIEDIGQSMRAFDLQLTPDQKNMALSLGFFQKKEDGKTSAHIESLKEVVTKEMYLLTEKRDIELGRKAYTYQSAKNHYESKDHIPWEKDAIFKDELEKKNYFIKLDYIKERFEWKPLDNSKTEFFTKTFREMN